MQIIKKILHFLCIHVDRNKLAWIQRFYAISELPNVNINHVKYYKNVTILTDCIEQLKERNKMYFLQAT